MYTLDTRACAISKPLSPNERNQERVAGVGERARETRLQQMRKGIRTTPLRIISNCKHSTQNLPLSQLEGITESTPHASLCLLHHIQHNQILFTPLPTTRTPTPIQILADWGTHKPNSMPVLYAKPTPFLTYREYKHADPASTLTPLGMTVCLDDPLTDPMKRGVLRKDTGDSSTIDRASKRLSTRVLLFIPNDVNRAWHPH